MSSLVAVASLACSAQQQSPPPSTTKAPAPPAATSKASAPAPTSSAPTSAPFALKADGTLKAPVPDANAISYDPLLAPIGARMSATLTPSEGSTVATLTISGFLPNRGYAVHAHVHACSLTGDDAGPHFQNHVDPVATAEHPSTDPQYANPSNEIWLDIRTDATGSGRASTTVPFVFTDRVPQSIVVHKQETTATGSKQAGMAGDRIACLTL